MRLARLPGAVTASVLLLALLPSLLAQGQADDAAKKAARATKAARAGITSPHYS